MRGSFNLGIGYFVEPNVRILGKGIEANKALPEGESEIRFRETDQGAVMVTLSYSF